jgi:hypothetical protein
MTRPADPYIDLDLDHSDPAMRRAIADLEWVCTAAVPPRRRAEIARLINTDTAQRPSERRHVWPFSSMRVPAKRVRFLQRSRRSARLVAAAAALLLALGGALGYLDLRQPATASAAPLLRQAARATVNGRPGQVLHEIIGVQRMQADGSAESAVTIDRWTQLAGSSEAGVDMTQTSGNNALRLRVVADARGVLWIYRPATDSVVKSTWSPGTGAYRTPSLGDPNSLDFVKAVIGGLQDPYAMAHFLAAAARGSEGEVRVLPSQTIGGRAVDVVTISHRVQPTASKRFGVSTETLTVALDASSHLVRRVDLRGLTAHGATLASETLDVKSYQIVPASAVPAGTFTFTPPPGTTIAACAGKCLSGTETGGKDR